MKTKYFKYEFLVFLYAYLRQVDLSLDRSRWDSLKPFREYYKEQIQPKAVSDYLSRYSNLDLKKIQRVYFIKGATFFKKIKYLVSRLLTRNNSLTSGEICYCCQKLLILQDYLNSEEEIHKLEIEKLRIEFTKFTYHVLQYKLNVKDRERATGVEHYLQNESLNPLNINKFIKGFEFIDIEKNRKRKT